MDHRGRDIVIYVSDRGREAGENVRVDYHFYKEEWRKMSEEWLIN